MKFTKSFFYIGLNDNNIHWKEKAKHQKEFKESELFKVCNPNKKYKLERNAKAVCDQLNIKQNQFELQVIERCGMTL